MMSRSEWCQTNSALFKDLKQLKELDITITHFKIFSNSSWEWLPSSEVEVLKICNAGFLDLIKVISPFSSWPKLQTLTFSRSDEYKRIPSLWLLCNITKFLESCPNLENFFVQDGVVVKGDELNFAKMICNRHSGFVFGFIPEPLAEPLVSRTIQNFRKIFENNTNIHIEIEIYVSKSEAMYMVVKFLHKGGQNKREKDKENNEDETKFAKQLLEMEKMDVPLGSSVIKVAEIYNCEVYLDSLPV
jgi:hypothetical protein